MDINEYCPDCLPEDSAHGTIVQPCDNIVDQREELETLNINECDDEPQLLHLLNCHRNSVRNVTISLSKGYEFSSARWQAMSPIRSVEYVEISGDLNAYDAVKALDDFLSVIPTVFPGAKHLVLRDITFYGNHVGVLRIIPGMSELECLTLDVCYVAVEMINTCLRAVPHLRRLEIESCSFDGALDLSGLDDLAAIRFVKNYDRAVLGSLSWLMPNAISLKSIAEYGEQFEQIVAQTFKGRLVPAAVPSVARNHNDNSDDDTNQTLDTAGRSAGDYSVADPGM